jgi:hypothetical protein
VTTTLLYAAAHADFPDTEPLGGGKAVADHLIQKWREESRLSLQVLSPRSLRLPLAKPLVQMSELQYARFCRDFEQASLAEILRHDPRESVVLANDISEGPDFRVLGERGYQIVTIFHVDVVEYFTKFYLRNLVPPFLLTRWHSFPLLPNVLRLVFQLQCAIGCPVGTDADHDLEMLSLVRDGEDCRPAMGRCIGGIDGGGHRSAGRAGG